MKVTFKEIELPRFGGFYGDDSIEYELQCLYDKEYVEGEIGKELTDDEYNAFFEYLSENLIDWKGTQNNVCEWLVESSFSPYSCLSDFCAISFNKMTSPQYYNYSTDKIWVDVTFETKKQLKAFEKYCFIDNAADFDAYLKNYHSSRSGYISFVENNLNEFKKEYETDEREKDKNLSVMLDFVLMNNSRTGWDIILPYECDVINECFEYTTSDSVAELYQKHIQEVNEKRAKEAIEAEIETAIAELDSRYRWLLEAIDKAGSREPYAKEIEAYQREHKAIRQKYND
jgi:hypothetical protein